MNGDLLFHVTSSNNTFLYTKSKPLPLPLHCVSNVAIISMPAVLCVAIGDTTLLIALDQSLVKMIWLDVLI
jgi:hypothetical protein